MTSDSFSILAHSARVAGLLILSSLCLHGLKRADLLPPFKPSRSVDSIVLAFQSKAAQSPSRENLILTGDSSCLMGASTLLLERESSGALQAVNLGTLSYLPLDHFAKLAALRMANRTPAPWVILLINPEMATRTADETASASSELNTALAPISSCNREERNWTFTCPLGLQIFRDHFLNHLVPSLLPGSYGRHYGFNWDLTEFMKAEKGGLIDPNRLFVRPGETREWKTSEYFKAQAQRFRQSLPPGTQLAFGLTPVPREFAGPTFEADHAEMLQQISSALQADRSLELPSTLPAASFATSTHLNAHGRTQFSRHLLQTLQAAITFP